MAALICDSFGKVCSKSCACLAVPCKLCCDGINDVICSPFAPYIGITAILNIPPALWGLRALGEQCSNYWLKVNAVFCVIHVIASFYIANRIQNYHDEDVHYTPPSNEAGQTPYVNASEMEKGGKHQKDVIPVAVTPVSPSGTKRTTGFASFKAAICAVPRDVEEEDEKEVKFDGVQASVYDMNTRTSSRPSVDTKSTPVATAVPISPTSVASSRRTATATGTFRVVKRKVSPVRRMGQVLCYDGGVALYIFAAVAWMLWQTIGFSRAFVTEEGDGACRTTTVWTLMSITMGFTYSMVVACAFLCSFACLG